MHRFKFSLIVLSISAIIPALSPLAQVVSAAPAGGTGLTTAVVATSGQTITGNIDATGFDIGIYIGPGVTNVMVNSATVSGANDEGILVQDTSGIVISNSTIENNGNTGNTHGGTGPGQLSEDKGIVLAGTVNCQVMNNIVQDNGHGGISVLDDGPNTTFALNPVTVTPIAGTGNTISGNLVQRNAGDCGIVVAAKNPGGGVYNNIVSNNTVTGGWSGIPGSSIPYIGGIIIAGGAFGPVVVNDTVVQNNTVTGGLIPGISLHAFGPGTMTGTELTGNVLSGNGQGELSGNTTGIEIFAVPNVGVITQTQVVSDTISSDYYGIWHSGDTYTKIDNLDIELSVTIPIGPVVEIKVEPTTINLNVSSWPIYVVVYGSATFNVHDINFNSVTLEGAPCSTQILYRDDNADGIPDVLLGFRAGQTSIVPGQTRATLIGYTNDGVMFSGTDNITIK